MIKQWRNLLYPGYEHYQVSNFGEIKNSNTNHVMSIGDNGHGYKTVKLKNKGQLKTVYIHREVARLFLDGFDEKKQVNHIDKDKENNNITNLEMVSDGQNKLWSKEEYIMGHLKSQGKILQIYRDGVLIDECLGLKQMCIKYNLDVRSVQRVIAGERKTHKGLTFKYKET